mmetsp:Transcript_15867/g.34334  ORF Transcript_15867/g.34334 Transcript_15867/m.34334 type:complete len:254 (-) Transcript_15867:804-1565(-)
MEDARSRSCDDGRRFDEECVAAWNATELKLFLENAVGFEAADALWTLGVDGSSFLRLTRQDFEDAQDETDLSDLAVDALLDQKQRLIENIHRNEATDDPKVRFAVATVRTHENGESFWCESACTEPNQKASPAAAIVGACAAFFSFDDSLVSHEWERAQERQMIVHLTADVMITTSDGESRFILRGTPVLFEDIFGRGHKSERVSEPNGTTGTPSSPTSLVLSMEKHARTAYVHGSRASTLDARKDDDAFIAR